jgi:hypothetical protein
MHIAIVQISDLHVKGAQDGVLERAPLVVAALRSIGLRPEACFVATPGDIAFSGRAEQYSAADTFYTELLRGIEQEYPGVKPQAVFAPGNHDCNLGSASDVRDVELIESRLGTLDIAGATVQHCLAVQNEYFSFVERYGQLHRSTLEKFTFRREFQTSGSHTVAFTLINTAWLTQDPERAGRLYFPVRVLSPLDSPADIEVAIFHHPYNWLNPDNSVEFRAAIESRSDFILTGHQHHLHQFRKETDDGTAVYFIEGMAMFDKQASINGFNVITVDIDSSQWQVHAFQWDTNRFLSSRPSQWRPFLRNRTLTNQGFRNTKDFATFLADPGTGFTHPRKREIRLHDLFVYPSLLQRPVQVSIEKPKPSATVVSSKNVLEFVREHDHVLLVGDDKSGKTALAKTLYLDLQREAHLVTLFLDGRSLYAADFRDITALVRREFGRQYEGQSCEAFLQLDRNSCGIVIDDFDSIPLGPAARSSVIEELERRFGKVIVFVSDGFEIDLLTGKTDSPVFVGYRQYVIQEFGHALRGKLISKWVALGRDEYTLDESYSREVDTREQLVSTLLGKQLLPSSPVMILGILQALEATRSLNTASGSYGELYEALITDRLASISAKATDLGTKYTLISRLAYSLFIRERQWATREEFRLVYQEYYNEYGIHLDPDRFADDLKAAGILDESDGNLRFKYAYYYQFFTARYFRDNIQDASESWALRGKIREMAESVYFEEYASILVFYLYLTKDSAVIRVLVDNARRIYADMPPCNLEEDVASVNRLYVSPPKPIALPDGDVEVNREEYRMRMDELERDAPRDGKGEKLAYSDDLSDIVKFNIALKILHILGQVVRNFPGSLKREVKSEIAAECYLLGLRLLSVVLKCVDVNQDVLREYFARMIRDQRASARSSELPRSAEEAILRLLEVWSFGLVKIISRSVGLPELEDTYRDVLKNHGGLLSVQFVDLSIRLDHYLAFPGAQLEDLHLRTRGNVYGAVLLRDLVVHYFYLFECKPKTRDKYTRLLGIGTKAPKLLGGGLQKEDC